MRAQVLKMTAAVLSLPRDTLGRSEAELDDLLRLGMELESLFCSLWESKRAVRSFGAVESWLTSLVVTDFCRDPSVGAAMLTRMTGV